MQGISTGVKDKDVKWDNEVILLQCNTFKSLDWHRKIKR